VRQRNDTGSPLESHELRLTIWPGDEIHHHQLIAGCTPLDDPDSGGGTGGTGPEEAGGSPAGAKKPSRHGKSASEQDKETTE
jgi:hypothetical protein